MKKLVFVLVAALMCSTTAMAIDIACSTQVSWWPEATAQREMQEIADNVPVPVEIFSSSQDAALADWLVAHTGNGQSDLLILCGRVPTSIYTGGNAQPDGSIAELFLDDGNCIINTGDWFFYVSNPNNEGNGLANLMDVPGISMSDPIVAVTPTADGQLYTPSFAGFSPSRPWHLEQLNGTDWVPELILGINADGRRADPAIIKNTVTGARVGSFYQVADTNTDERGVVISEWINNWYLLNVNTAGPVRNPVPATGATDVLRDGVLSWTPGPYPGTHNVYFGESYEDVNSMTAPTASGLTEASFAPGRLEFDKTYFWRVDEVNASPDKTVYEGKIWNFEVEPYSTPIPVDVSKATASSSAPKNLPGLTVDGSGLVGNAHSTISETMWLSGMPDLAPWLMYEFARSEELDTMLIWNSNSASEGFVGWGIKDVNIEYSSDGVEWTALAEPTQLDRAPGLATYNTPQVIDFGGVEAKYVKLNIKNNWGGILMQYGLSEVQFYGIPVHARQPVPASGSSDIRPDAVVSWRAGREAGQHTLYVSDDPNAVADGSATSISSTTNSASLSLFDLQMGGTYYWRVNEVNDAETTTVWSGPVWTLNTATALIVDDFESYTNLSPDRPFQTWLDGFGYSADEFFPVGYPGNGTGAGIGHDIWSLSSPHYDGDIMETTNTIAGSGQSMPFYYSNTGGVASQTERVFSPAQDWTVGRAKTLSIAFRGQAGNTGTLYVKINNTKVTYPRDPGNIARAVWQAWNIDLTTVNTNLQNVTQLVIGVDGSSVNGMVLIDDITLNGQAGELITPVQPEESNLVLHYTFDEGAGSSIADASGHGNTATFEVLPMWDTGVSGGAASFNGTSNYVTAPANAWSSVDTQFTLSFWAKGDPKGDSTVASNWTVFAGDAAGRIVSCHLPWSSQVIFDTTPGWANERVIVDAAPDELSGQWRHWTFVRNVDTGEKKIYMDGILYGSTTPSADPITGIDRFLIGAGNGAVSPYTGQIDDFRLYNKALSDEEILWLAGARTPIDKPF